MTGSPSRVGEIGTLGVSSRLSFLDKPFGFFLWKSSKRTGYCHVCNIYVLVRVRSVGGFSSLISLRYTTLACGGAYNRVVVS